MSFVQLLNNAWVPLWGNDPNRSFAAVIGGTGVEGDIVYVTDNPALSPGDPGVAEFWGVRGALYFETRGVNALYARTNLTDPLVVRTTTAIQVPKVPAPIGLVGEKDYRVVTRTGGGAVSYVNDLWAPVLGHDDTRLRATLTGDQDLVMVAQRFADPGIIALLVPTIFAASGPAFPGPLVLEGPDGIQLLNIGDAGMQENCWHIRDHKEILP